MSHDLTHEQQQFTTSQVTGVNRWINGQRDPRCSMHTHYCPRHLHYRFSPTVHTIVSYYIRATAAVNRPGWWRRRPLLRDQLLHNRRIQSDVVMGWTSCSSMTYQTYTDHTAHTLIHVHALHNVPHYLIPYCVWPRSAGKHGMHFMAYVERDFLKVKRKIHVQVFKLLAVI